MYPPIRTAVRFATLPILLAAVVASWHPAAPADARPPDGPRPTAATHKLTLVPHSKVGTVDGTRAYIGLSFDGRRLRAYVCDGGNRRKATISQWFKSHWDGRSPLTLVRNGIELQIDAVHPDGRITGHLTAFSGPHRFSAWPATGPTGLYDGVDRRKRLRATWIVLADRSFRGNMAPTRPPRRVCRFVTVALADGTTTERVACFDV
jgi:hypothetical protein